MKKIYFVSNNLMSKIKVLYSKETTFNEVREKTMLNSKGEEKAKSLLNIKELENIEAIYSSLYFGALATCKYIAESLELDINVDKRLNERVIGQLGCNEYRFLKVTQEHDFSYKLSNGESINDVKKRMEDFLIDLLESTEKNVLVVTHNVALFSLMTNWCNKGFNLNDRMILDYKDEVVFDGVFHEMDLIEVLFDDGKFISIKRLI